MIGWGQKFKRLERVRLEQNDYCTLLNVMIAFLPYLGYAKYKKKKKQL